MTIDPLIQRAYEAHERSKRYGRMEMLTLIVIVVFVAIGLSLGLYFKSRQDNIRHLQERQTCIVLLNAEFDSAVADALAAPPAPNPMRDAAVARLHAVSNELHHIETVCP